MMKTLVLFMLIVSAASAQDFPAGVYPGSSKAAQLPPREPRLLFFMADWCGPCHVAVDLEALPGTNPPQPGGFRKWLKNWTINDTNQAHIQLVNFDRNPELAARYKVTQLPSVVLIDGESHHDAIPYVNMQAMTKLFEKPKAAATTESFDLKRVGCKLRPDLGSGVNTDQGVITCWHCVESGKPIIVECDGETATGVVVAYDAAADVAILSVPWKNPHPAVPISDNIASGLTCVARTREGPIGIERYTVIPQRLAISSEPVWLDKPFISSQSGGGLVDDLGELAGIVSGNSIEQEPFHGLMIPANVIQRVLKKVAR